MNNMPEQIDDTEYAIALSESERGKYIMAKSLYLAYQYLDAETDDRHRQPSDMYDIMALLTVAFPNYYKIFQKVESKGIQV